MSTSVGSVVATIRAQDEISGVVGKIQGAIGGLTGIMTQMGGVMGEAGNIINSAFSGFVTGGPAGAALAAGTAGLGAVVTGIQACVKEATASEAVWATLGAAVERSGQSWQTMKKGTEDALLAMSKVTVYSDEQLAQALEKLMTFGLSYDQAMKALGVTIDFAAAKHMDLESAATLVGKAVDGNTALMKRYGVDITVAKDAADKMTPVLSALNEQFGGAAQAAAKTYAGAQERLNNAWGEVQEKVGNIVLPALASLTEGMIPVADAFGRGVDAVSAWFAEVGKMPEVQGFVNAAQTAFDGLWKGMQDFWAFLSETFGPVLKELGDALHEVFVALAPIGEAFGEVWAAITGGQEGGDWLKDFLRFVAQFIREVVVPAIKEAVPVIRAFAEAFKDAADFALPILTQIRDAITSFVEAVKTIFYGFYQWLVGGSLWVDLWNAVLSIASSMMATLLSDLGTKLFEPMKAAFTAATQALDAVWNAGWAAIQSSLSGALSAAQGILQGGVNTMKGIWEVFVKGIGDGIQQIKNLFGQVAGALAGAGQDAGGAMQTVGSAVTGAVQAAQSTAQGAMSTVVSTFQNAFNTVANAATGFYNWLVGHSIWTDMLTSMQYGTDTAFLTIELSAYNFFQLLSTAFTEGLAALNEFWSAGWLQAQDLAIAVWTQVEALVLASMQNIMKEIETSMAKLVQVTQAELTALLYVWQSIFSNMGLITSLTMAQIVQTMQTSLQRIRELAMQIKVAMVTGSIWPDMLNAMRKQTETAMGSIVRTFQGGFENISLGAGYAAPLASAAPREGGGRGGAYPQVSNQRISIPVNVQVDGETITRLVEERMVYTRWARGRGFEA